LALESINNDTAQKPLDGDQNEADKKGDEIERIKTAVKQVRDSPTEDGDCSGQNEQNAGNNNFGDVIGSRPLKNHRIITNAKKARHDDACRRQADVRKGNLFKNVVLPPKCQQEEEEGGADQGNWKMDKYGVWRLNDQQSVDNSLNESHEFLLFNDRLVK
jgi:hypothetical protein